MVIIDSQVHTYDANTPRWPWQNQSIWVLPHVTGEEVIAAMDSMGIDGAILVSSRNLYGFDASYAVEVKKAFPARFAIVKPVDCSDKAVEENFAEWKKTPGAVGVRIVLTDHHRSAADSSAIDRTLRAAARYDLPVNFLCWGNLEIGTQIIDRHPETLFIVDHMGILQPGAPSEPWSDLPRVIELAKRVNAVLKVTGACTLARTPYPFPDIWPPLARIFEAWGFERCLWGTDWTRALSSVSYKESVDAFLATDRLNETERAMLMGGACAKTYGWTPESHPTSRGYSPT